MKLLSIRESEMEKMFGKFCDEGVFTFEGLDLSTKENLNDFLENFEKLAQMSGVPANSLVGYRFTGADMNKMFGLTGSNAYKDNLTFVCIPGYYDVKVKELTAARWFDDICCNNRIRQNAVDYGCAPDYN